MNRILQCDQLLYTIDKSYASVFFFFSLGKCAIKL